MLRKIYLFIYLFLLLYKPVSPVLNVIGIASSYWFGSKAEEKCTRKRFLYEISVVVFCFVMCVCGGGGDTNVSEPHDASIFRYSSTDLTHSGRK
jgi:hypothetical protein